MIENSALVEHMEVGVVDGSARVVAIRLVYTGPDDDFKAPRKSPMYILQPQQADELIEALTNALEISPGGGRTAPSCQ
ncbi:hypothetical protein [Pandoraea pulmonicola]|uniref:Uncharacterized protein n=1 Tax=Pandoraea pulmonicola TaxID=93221 RepID=A0AAJ5D378_PANPU|nr:hypothetical protein [Pandoraea pulmonicola]SUD95573.1 Uncharacterised protein [Pandoraea pulmonicola]